MLTPDEIKSMREYVDRATPGEWSTLGEPNEVHAIEFADGGGDPLHVCEDVPKAADAEFIAHARTDVPKVLDALDEARAEVERLKAALELIAAPKRADGTYNHCREACEELARKALSPGEGK